jgi:malyl-CoA/(S)-citramalyl-CoA lyase
MSFTLIQQATPRLHRSELAVPGSNPSLFEKAAKGAADIIFLDLEDAVAPDDKEQARKNIVQGLNDLDWGSKTMMIRINGLDTHYCYRDVVDVVENCPRLDMILIPKTGVPQDVYAIDMLVTQIEQAKKREKKIGFECLIETALGMANVEAIAQSSRRLEALSSASPTMRHRPAHARSASAARIPTMACSPTRTTAASATISGAIPGTSRCRA